MSEGGDDRVLDYAPPPPPLKRRDSAEYYREQPPVTEWAVGLIVCLLIAFGVAIGMCTGSIKLP